MHIHEIVTIIGLGYVGLPLSILCNSKKYSVNGIDLNSKRIEDLKNKKLPFYNEELQEELLRNTIFFTTDFSVINKSNIVIICVPTPVYQDNTPNLEPVKNATKEVARHLKKGQLIILESTVNPGVCDEEVIPILEEISGLICGSDFHLAHCPERINPGDKKWTVENINRVVGSSSEEGLNRAAKFYESIISGKVKKMDNLKEAEAVKIVENSFRDVNIAFVNELARSFDKLGIDVVNVINGAATKPFAFMAHYPGCGVGGHCIPVDPYYLIEYASKKGFDHEFLKTARRINNNMPEYTVEKLMYALNLKKKPLNGSKIAVLGIAYKKNVDDVRESPSLEIQQLLKKSGAEVKAFDPYVLSSSNVSSLEDALEDTDAIVIATDHDYFKQNITPEYLISKKINLIIDGKNCLDKNLFISKKITYHGIGR